MLVTMPVQIALVRAINVGGRNLVAMSDLRDLLGALGFADARSLLQSGNLIFEGQRAEGGSARTGAGGGDREAAGGLRRIHRSHGGGMESSRRA